MHKRFLYLFINLYTEFFLPKENREKFSESKYNDFIILENVNNVEMRGHRRRRIVVNRSIKSTHKLRSLLSPRRLKLAIRIGKAIERAFRRNFRYHQI